MKIRLPIAFVLVVIIALVVGVLSIVEFPCPVCDGTGIIIGAKGLKVERVERELVEYESSTIHCGFKWGKFTYAVNMLIVNEETNQSYGYVLVAFYAPSVGQTEASEYPISRILTYIKIPAKTAENIERVLVFEGFSGSEIYEFHEEEPHRVSVEVAEEILCPYCDEKGKLPFTEWVKTIIK